MCTISVVIPTYNRPDLLSRALDSVMGQNRKADEIIIVDNGTTRVLRELLPAGVTLLSAPSRAGASQARNIGATCARSDFIAFLDDDDYWHAKYLQAVLSAIHRQSQARLLVGSLYDSETKDPVTGKNALGDHSLVSLIRRNPGFVGSNLVFQRHLFLSVGGFDSKLSAGEDLDIVIRLLQLGIELVRIPEGIVFYDSSHPQFRLSNLHNLVFGKRALLQKHIDSPFLRFWLLGDYTLRTLLSRFRSKYQS